MKKQSFLLLLALFLTASAHAEWVVVSRSDEFTLFVERASIRRDGDFVRYWQLTNYLMPKISGTGKKYLSAKSQARINCKDESSAFLHMSAFTDKDGEGKPVFSETPAPDKIEWTPTLPGSVMANVSDFVCDTSRFK